MTRPRRSLISSLAWCTSGRCHQPSGRSSPNWWEALAPGSSAKWPRYLSIRPRRRGFVALSVTPRGGPSRVSRVGGWEAGPGYQAGIAEHGDTGDAGGGDGEDSQSERVVGSVTGTVVGGRGGLAVCEGGSHQPVSGGTDHVREVTQAGRAAGEPGAGADQLYRGVGAQCLLQGCDVGILESGDVLAEQFPGPRFGGLDHLLWLRSRFLDSGAGPLQGALDRRGRGAEHGRALGGREPEPLPEQKYRPQPAGQVLQAGDEGEPQALPRGDDGRGIRRVGGDPRVRDRIKPS